MEKRTVAPLLLAGAGFAVAVAIGVLMVKVRAAPAPPSVGSPVAGAPRPATPAPEVEGDDDGDDARTPPRGNGMVGTRAPLPTFNKRLQASSEPEIERPAQAPPLSVDHLGDRLPGGEDAEDPMEGGATEKVLEANQLYDRGDYEGAMASADDILKTEPDNARALRIAISSACVLGNEDKARTLYSRMTPRDQRKISRRCKRYGIEF